MVFKCQEDSFLKEFSSRVVSCKENPSKNDLYDVILENTILFPEGGGQPSDTGYLNDLKVLQVFRKGALAVHIVDKPLEIGQEVTQKIDWERRFDHMQQHSGQHLLSAILERDFNLPTLSWWLGEEVSYVELDTPQLKQEQITGLESTLNQLIQQALPVTVQVYDSIEEIQNGHTRGLPDDHVGDIRVITIAGIDDNMCCGTHVKNLSQLQVIKVLHTEKSKRKGKILLHFLVGNRVLKTLHNCLEREKKLTILLKNNATEHPMLVEKLLKSSKAANKTLQTVLKDLALYEAGKFKVLDPPPKYFTLYKKEADADFLQVFLREIGDSETLLFLAVGEDKGNIILTGPIEIVSELKDKIAEILQGKGALKGNKFQAKVDRIKDVTKVEQLLKDYFK